SEKLFVVEVRVNDETLAVGRGRTKKEAEKDAARKAYEKLVAEKT
ncbi:MAG: ribonuclease, partial [Thermotoga sp.]|nr:ribonuclease [Thermotoga sp.]